MNQNNPAPPEAYTPALQGAYHKGVAAARAGEPAQACPYAKRRKAAGGPAELEPGLYHRLDEGLARRWWKR
jgi:hypothetical protein